MDEKEIKALLDALYEKRETVDSVFTKLKNLPYEDMEFAKVDHHRRIRQGMPEVIFCQGKTKEHIADIFSSLAQRNDCVIATRAWPEAYNAVLEVCPDAVFHPLARCITLGSGIRPIKKGKVLIAAAGTADLPVAEEAAVVAEFLGNPIEKIYDIGVAGIHRLFSYYKTIQEADVIICVAGMEGALASVLGGLVDKPVIAVPSSVGYGASFQGLAALLAMLNSCAAGVGVMNIDNGFGAAVLANNINKIGGYNEEDPLL